MPSDYERAYEAGHSSGMAQQRVDWQQKMNDLEDKVAKLTKTLERLRNKSKIAADRLEQFVELVSEAVPLGWTAGGDQEKAYDWEKKAEALLNEK